MSKDPANNANAWKPCLNTAVRGLRTLAVLLSPVIPEATATLWTALGGAGAVTDERIDTASDWTGCGAHVTTLDALFPRIEVSE